MIVREAREAAHHWVMAEGSRIPGFRGAFFHGSIARLPDSAVLPATSDVDLMVVLTDTDTLEKPGKFRYQDVLLEVSYLSREELTSPEAVLGRYELAGSLRAPGVIADPTGWLTAQHQAVTSDFAKREWVVKRGQAARDKILHGYTLREADPFPAQVTAWLFPTGITTNILLVAGLRNPTVRLRYLAVRELLAEHGRLDFYETLLELLGCAGMTQVRAEDHLAALTAAFDAAKTVIRTPFFFAADVTDASRPVAIDGSRELIASGDRREAIFWMAATSSRCQLVFHHDAPALEERFAAGYRDLVEDLGITSFVDLQRRYEQVKATLPKVWEAAEAIMAANKRIED